MDERSRLNYARVEPAVVPQIEQTTIRGTDSSSFGTLNALTPCAACKLLKRRCSKDCPFFPYFSPLETQNFAAVHKIFGASNVSKLLMEVPESQRLDAANSLVYEAKVRINDPIHGCMGIICSLQRQVESLQAELQQVSLEIIKRKYIHSKREDTTFPTSSLYNHPHNSTDQGHCVNIFSSENDRYFG